MDGLWMENGEDSGRCNKNMGVNEDDLMKETMYLTHKL